MTLFIVGYWFYELGFPLGISEPRLAQEIEHQQVTAVERGYNVYQANCARCHGPQGLGPNEPDAAEVGYIGPTLNDQAKLFNHLNENYLRNVLLVGGRYVCGNAKSAMPVWSDQANPPGPLNYRQIDELIAFLRATNEHVYVVKDPELNEPEIDAATGEEKTFTGWRDPNYKPDPGATPYPDCYLQALGGGAVRAAHRRPRSTRTRPSSPSRRRPARRAPGSNRTRSRQPADTPFTLEFDNQDATAPHNVVIKDPSGANVSIGDTAPVHRTGEEVVRGAGPRRRRLQLRVRGAPERR